MELLLPTGLVLLFIILLVELMERRRIHKVRRNANPIALYLYDIGVAAEKANRKFEKENPPIKVGDSTIQRIS